MTNTRLINEATDLAVIYYQAHHYTKNPITLYPSIRSSVEDWYNHTDITDAEILAAAALEFPSFECIPFSILTQITETYFPHCSVEEETDTRWDF